MERSCSLNRCIECVLVPVFGDQFRSRLFCSDLMLKDPVGINLEIF